jgi:hypothetical protein
VYNNYIKLTEQYTRDKTRTVYINLDQVVMVAENGTGSRLFFSHAMYDVLESPASIIGGQVIVLTDKEEVDGGSRNEDGRPSNPAIKSNS